MIAGISVACSCHGNAGPQDGTAVRIQRLRLNLPPSWRQVPPTSEMRALQAVIPGSGGDAELAVYFFGVGQGGNIEANLQRWMNQVIPEPGTAPQRETFESGALRVTWVDAEGMLKPGEMGMGPAAARPGRRSVPQQSGRAPRPDSSVPTRYAALPGD